MLNDILNEALPLWGQVAGILDEHGEDADAKASAGKPYRICRHYDEKGHAEDLSGSRLCDPSGRTTLLLLRGLAEHYLREAEISVLDLVRRFDEVSPAIDRGRRLLALLFGPEVEQAVAEARGELVAACDHYELDAEHRAAVLSLPDYEVGILTYHARRSLEKLRRFDFAQAEGSGSPGYNPWVCEFWNVASIVEALATQKVSGVTLVLFRDPRSSFQSYFALAIRSGGTISIFTDRPDDPHPAFADMARRPDRDLQRRAARHYFPYDLLNFEEREDPASRSGRTRLYEEQRHQVAPIDTVGVRVRLVRDLKPDQFVWLAGVFREVLVASERGDRAPALAYTANMVREPAALQARCAALQAPGAYVPLELPPVTREDLAPEAIASQWERPSTGFNRWMVDRYGARVPEEAFNVVSEAEAERLLPALREQGLLPPAPEAWRPERDKRSPLRTLGPNHFGTAEAIDRDRKWAARVNQCQVVQRLAETEHKAEADKVLKWYRDAVERGTDRFAQALAVGVLELPEVRFAQMGDDEDPKQGSHNALARNVRVADKDTTDCHGKLFRYSDYFTLGRKDRSWKFLCLDREVVASVAGLISPTCPEAIAVLCGVRVADLPWPLRHWYSSEPYSGNHILNRLDPEDWVLKNPWLRLRLGFVVALSKTAYRARRRAAGLDPDGVLAPAPDSSRGE